MKFKHIVATILVLILLALGFTVFTIAKTPSPKPSAEEIRLCDLAVEKVIHDGMVTDSIKNWPAENAPMIKAAGALSCNVRFDLGAMAILMEGSPSSGWSSWLSNDNFDAQGYNVKYATQHMLTQADRPIRIVRSKRNIQGKDAIVELIVASNKE